jgi:hypothetical protein
MARATTFEKIRDERTLGQNTRLPLLRDLQDKLKRRVVAFFCSPFQMEGMIWDDDADMVTEVLTNTREPKGVALIVSSPGGSALGAERIVHACREASGGDFLAIVPGQAKSAATIICLGASCIQMTATAELGPIDPQIPIQSGGDRPNWLPAHVIIRSYETLMKAAEESEGRIEPFMLQLDRYDAREIEDIRREIALSKKIAKSLLSTGMMKGKSEADVDGCLEPFLDPEVTGSHGRPIFPAMAKGCGLTVEDLPSNSPLWEPLWEYYWRATSLVSSGMAPKLLENPTSSLRLGAPSD